MIGRDGLQDAARIRSRNRHGRPMLGDGGQIDLEFAPLDLQQVLEGRHHLDRVGSGGGHYVVMLGEPRGGAVIEHETVFAQHDAVTYAPDGEVFPAVDVDAFEEFGGIAALEIDLAERGYVDQADSLAHGKRFAVHRVEIGFARACIELGAPPQSRVDESCASRGVPRIHRGQPQGRHVRAALRPGDRAKCDRRVRRTERRRADLRNLRLEQLREDGKPVDIRELALIGAHAECRVAFQMLDRRVTLARGEREIGSGHIVLEIDEALVARVDADLPQRLERCGMFQRCVRSGRGSAIAATCGERGSGAGGESFPKACGERHRAVRAAGRSWRARGGRRIRRGNEGRETFIVDELSFGLRMQMHGGTPAAGHADEIAVQRRGGRTCVAVVVDIRNLDRGNAASAAHTLDRAAEALFDAGQRRLLGCMAEAACTDVDNRGDVDAVGFQVERGRMAGVVVGKHDRAQARFHRVAIGVGSRG